MEYMKIYLASPIAQTKEKDSWNESEEKLDRNEIISQKLKEIGLDIYLPQINQKKTGAETLTEQLKVIRNCDFLILVLSDTRGIYIEAGYAKALGKKVYALEVEEMRKYSDWLIAFCDYIAKDINDLVNYLKKDLKNLREDLIGELGAINQYQEHIDETDNEEIKKVLEHIKDDEKEHVAELTKIIRQLDKTQEEKFQKEHKGRFFINCVKSNLSQSRLFLFDKLVWFGKVDRVL